MQTDEHHTGPDEAASQPDAADQPDAQAWWTERYGDAPIWSGRPNRAVVETAEALRPGRVLELGSGEGGDALWFAEQGWQVTAVDIAPNALDRGRAEAERRGLGDRVTWQQADLTTWHPDERYDLVSAAFLHSSVAFPRAAVLRGAAAAVAADGHLLVVGHAGSPSWADSGEHVHAEPLVGPEEQVAQLALDDGWTVVVAELRTRDVTAPDGSPATLEDTVVLVRRAATA